MQVHGPGCAVRPGQIRKEGAESHRGINRRADGPRVASAIRGQPSPHDRHTPRGLHKERRPLLDYALRPKRWRPYDQPDRFQTENPGMDPEMVRVLVDEGADVNARAQLHDGRTVFELFIASCYEACNPYGRPRTELMQAWYCSACILVGHGARLDGKGSGVEGDRILTTEDLLLYVFGGDMTPDLKDLSLAYATSRTARGLWPLWGRKLLWDMLQWMFLVFWSPFINAITRR